MTTVAAVKKRPCAGGWNCTAPGRPWHRAVTEALGGVDGHCIRKAAGRTVVPPAAAAAHYARGKLMRRYSTRCPPGTSVVLTGYSARTGYLCDAGGDAERDEREEQDDELAGGERADEARVRRHRLRADVRDDVGRVE